MCMKISRAMNGDDSTGPLPRRRPPLEIKSRLATEVALQEAVMKLVQLSRERYIMKRKAQIMGCLQGKSFAELENYEWYDYSGCSKKYCNQ